MRPPTWCLYRCLLLHRRRIHWGLYSWVLFLLPLKFNHFCTLVVSTLDFGGFLLTFAFHNLVMLANARRYGKLNSFTLDVIFSTILFHWKEFVYMPKYTQMYMYPLYEREWAKIHHASPVQIGRWIYVYIFLDSRPTQFRIHLSFQPT